MSAPEDGKTNKFKYKKARHWSDGTTKDLMDTSNLGSHVVDGVIISAAEIQEYMNSRRRSAKPPDELALQHETAMKFNLYEPFHEEVKAEGKRGDEKLVRTGNTRCPKSPTR